MCFDESFWNSFKDYLSNIQKPNSVKVRVYYAKKYHSVLVSCNAQEILIIPRPTHYKL